MTPPLDVRAQKRSPPAAIATKPLPKPGKSTGLVPMKLISKPQHLTPPLAKRAQVYSPAAAIDATPLARPDTPTGIGLSISLKSPPLPSWPSPSSPQHL